MQQQQQPPSSELNQPFNAANLQQYPSLVQNLHEPPNQQAVTNNLTQNLPGLLVDATADKLKASLNLSDKFQLNQPHLNQPQQQQHHSKLRHDEWTNRGGSDYATPTNNTPKS